jgi:hypothetical protein
MLNRKSKDDATKLVAALASSGLDIVMAVFFHASSDPKRAYAVRSMTVFSPPGGFLQLF